MATALERVMAPAPAEVPAEHRRRPIAVLYGPLAVALTVWGAILARHAGDAGAEWLRVGLAVAWAAAGTLAVARRPDERIGPLVLRGTLVGAVTSLAASALRAHAHHTGLSSAAVDAAQLVRAIGVALLPVLGMHILLGIPDGFCRVARSAVASGYGVGLVVGLVIWLQRPALPLWPVYLEALVAGTVGF